MKEIKFIEKLIRQAYKKCILSVSREDMDVDNHIKDHNNHSYDFATICDLAVENYLKTAIAKRYPNDKFICEESENKSLTDDRTWIIDPIDGTINFYHNIPMWCIQLALMENKECKLSVIFCPGTNEMYVANEHGAWCNGKPLSVNKNIPVKKAIFNMCGLMQKNEYFYNMQMHLVTSLGQQLAKVKMFGSAGFEYCCVASGRVHAYWVTCKTIWDWLPGKFICEKAGCSILERDILGNKMIAACANDEIKHVIEKEINNYINSKKKSN